jgi:hypothetical protein
MYNNFLEIKPSILFSQHFRFYEQNKRKLWGLKKEEMGHKKIMCLFFGSKLGLH